MEQVIFRQRLETARMHWLHCGGLHNLGNHNCAKAFTPVFAYWYTPGVAAPCRAIQADPARVYELTNKSNMIAIVSDGSRVLGLGNIGPHARLPVMEGKALLFKYLGGVDAIPICLATQDRQEFVRTVKLLESSFGGINLEDIAQPRGFRILDELRHAADTRSEGNSRNDEP
jgi:malate dehydrogenase (oxaloacetate-decarboxylating)